MRNRVMLAGAALVLLASCSSGSDPGPVENVCDGVRVKLETDVNHCGACETVCPAQVHSQAACVNSQCGRTPCEAGWVDLDPAQPGCESVAAEAALPETGVVFWAFPAAGTYGGAGLTSTSYRTEGSLGESTPPAANGAVELQSDHYRNVTGFNAILH